FFQAEDGIRDFHVTGVQTCALPISGNRKAVGMMLNLGEWLATRVLGTGEYAERRIDVAVPGCLGRLRQESRSKCQGCSLFQKCRSEERRVGKESKCRRSPK